MDRERILKRLKAMPAAKVPHYICPNPNNAGKDEELVVETARVAGGILINHHSLDLFPWAFEIAKKANCKIALAVMEFAGYTYDDEGLNKIGTNFYWLKQRYPDFTPEFIFFHNESSENCNRVILSRYYGVIKWYYPSIPTLNYNSGINEVGISSRFPFAFPRDWNCFNLYSEDIRLMQNTILFNVDKISLPHCPTITLLGGYETDERKSYRDPIGWDRKRRYSPMAQQARGFQVLARSIRTFNMPAAIFYPFGPDKPDELEDFCNSLISYMCGWHQIEEPK